MHDRAVPARYIPLEFIGVAGRPLGLGDDRVDLGAIPVVEWNGGDARVVVDMGAVARPDDDGRGARAIGSFSASGAGFGIASSFA